MKEKTIKIPIYHGELTMILCSDWKAVNDKYSIEVLPNMDGVVFKPETDSLGTEYIVAFNRPPDGSVIAHESVHLVNLLSIDKGFRPDFYNDEHQAYLTEWFYEQIENFIKN
ncbi:hypothetical protein FY557_17560 [Chryseobacterium sp. SN22]|uniref:hypothetical protein n=1 Tax=Chryseobacterium sp. SN22 TaxID=2606431 RepID=UPI0011EDE5F9|nr:hypothetical protein [Chryseobacterium sp. SN22]KAA0126457.1 hypothetical protein FY557_17560 [Chryseobacterium sp. SN22]